MSGTSLDGIDAAVVRFEGDVTDLRWTMEAFHSAPYSPDQRNTIHRSILAGGAAGICSLHAQLGEWLAAAALDACARAGVDARDVDLIGSHGQTVWHEPPEDGRRGATLQLGCAATIAERTGIDVVSDFRARDIAAGGHGAPLVSWIDRVLFAQPGRTRVLLNIGGIGNLTRVPPRGSDEPLLAFDTGPGNVLIDAAVELATDGRETFDRDGRRGAAGSIDEELVRQVLSHPYFERLPPKSTGRELFGRPFLQDLMTRRPSPDPDAWNDIVATMTAITAQSIGDAYRRWVQPRGAEEVVVTGGGARNPTLVRMVAERVDVPVRTGDQIGIDVDAKEALAFAALAWAHARGIPGNVPEATGAAGPRILGSFTPGTRGHGRRGGPP
jgi:anhydro-N-acetylmuramic acid kinase